MELCEIILSPDFWERLAQFEKSNPPLSNELKERLVIAFNLDQSGRYLESLQQLKKIISLDNTELLRLGKVFGGTPREINPQASKGGSSNDQSSEECDACCQGMCLGLLLQSLCGGCQ